MALSDTQVGRAGEQLLAAIASLTSDGDLEFYRPETDDDHKDLEVGRKGHLGAAYVQVKSRTEIGADGYFRVHVVFPDGKPYDDPGFIYAFLLLSKTGVEIAWILASPDFNRTAERSTQDGALQLNFYARPAEDDRWSGWRATAPELGPKLLELIRAVPEGELPARQRRTPSTASTTIQASSNPTSG
jgi:hypothetical protein